MAKTVSVLVKDLDSGLSWRVLVGPDTRVSDVITSAKADSGLEICGLVHLGRLLQQDRPLAKIGEPWEFYACIRKGDDPPLAVRPISEEEREEMEFEFESHLLHSMPHKHLRELRQILPKGLDNVIITYFYRFINEDMGKARDIARCINEKFA
jgi:hypothetical protein